MLRRAFLASMLLFSMLQEAQAEQSEDARKEFDRGVASFKEDRYKDAVSAFRRAYALNPSWKLLYNIGQCEAAAKRYGLAVDSFEQYLFEGGDNVPMERRDEVLQELGRLREMVGTVRFEGPDGIAVAVDGTKRGVTPIAAGVLVAAGVAHVFSFERDGEPLGELEEKVRGGSSIKLKIPAPRQEGLHVDNDAFAPPEIETAETPEKRGLAPAFFWTGVGATAAFAATGFAMDMTVGSIKDDLADQKALDRAEAMQTTGIVFYSLAGAAAIATVVLGVLTDFRGEESEQTARVKITALSVDLGPGLTVEF